MTQLLQNAVYGTALILAAAALRGALNSRLLPEARLALWAVCLFRLFTPVAPTSALSFWGLFGREAREVPAPVPVAGPAAAPNVGIIAPVLPNGTAAPVTPAAPAEAGGSWGAVLAAVWIAVGAVLAARYALSYVRTRRAVGRAIPLGREDARYAALPRCARLREGPMDGAPLTFGVARPTVVLTPGLDGTELACVLAHEGVHARRRHNLWHYAAAMALTVFWWNPAVWLMARLIRRDVELSCDRAAVRRLGADRRAEYAAALITLSTQAEGGAFCHGFGPKRTEERIIAIMKYKKTTITGIALTLALVLAVTVGFASNPGEADADPNTEADTSLDADAQDSVISTPEPSAPGDAQSNDLPVYSDETEHGPEFVHYDSNHPDSILEEYEAMLTRLVAQGMCTQKTADDLFARMEALVERAKNGEISNLMFRKEPDSEAPASLFIGYRGEDDGPVYTYPVTAVRISVPPLDGATGTDDQDGMGICTREDCGNNSVHEHDGVIYKEWRGKYSAPAPSICTREDCPHQPSVHFHDLGGEVVYIGNEADTDADEQDEPPICLREDCPIQPSVHFHREDGSVSYISNDLPAYVDIEVCAVEGCPIQGEHFHHDPEVEDHAGDAGEPIACPVEAIDEDFYQKYGDSHHSSGHHSDGHH